MEKIPWALSIVLVEDAALDKLDEENFWDKQLLFEISNMGQN